MGKLEVLHDEGFNVYWEVTQTLLNEVHVLHDVAHDSIEMLHVGLLSWRWECQYELVSELVEKRIALLEVLDEIWIKVQWIWQVL